VSRTCAAAAALLLIASLAAGQTAFADSANSKAVPVLLPVTLKGNTEGKSSFSFGIGAATALGPDDISGMVTGSIETQGGLSTLFSATSESDDIDQSPSWDLGVAVSYAHLHDSDTITSSAGLPHSVRVSMVNACRQSCKVSDADPFCKAYPQRVAKHLAGLTLENFCADQSEAATKLKNDNTLKDDQRREKLKELLVTCIQGCEKSPDDAFCGRAALAAARDSAADAFTGNNICPGGKAIYDRHQDSIGRSVFPLTIVNAGIKVGRQKFEYRASAADTPNLLLSNTDYEAKWNTGASVTHIPKYGTIDPSFELQALVGSSWEASTKTVKSCAPAGDVPRKDPKPGEMLGPTDPGQTCKEATLGAPTQSSALTLAFRVGLFDGVNGNWRAAFGPEIRLPWTKDGGEPLELAVRLPIYGAATLFKDTEYKGILRLMPSVISTKNDKGEREIKVTFELALLGQRRLFTDQFDQL
jgi:hypothetical protein